MTKAAATTTKLASLKKCNAEQDEIVYFTFYPLTIFCFFLASDKFLLDDVSSYNNNVIIALTVCQVLTHEFCMNVIFISVLEVYRSNFDKSHKLCERPRVLELNSLIAIISIFALSVTATFGALCEPSTDPLTRPNVAMVVIPFWIVTKVVLLLSFLCLYVTFRTPGVSQHPPTEYCILRCVRESDPAYRRYKRNT